jgi:hypothetical protein
VNQIGSNDLFSELPLEFQPLGTGRRSPPLARGGDWGLPRRFWPSRKMPPKPFDLQAIECKFAIARVPAVPKSGYPVFMPNQY